MRDTPSEPSAVPEIAPRRQVGRGIRLAGSALAVCAAILLIAVVDGQLLGFLSLFGPATTSSATESKTFTVTDAPHVNARDIAGSIIIRAGSADHVIAQATRRVQGFPSISAADALRALSVTMTSQGNDVTITGDASATAFTSGSRTIDLTIIVPPTTTLAVANAAGNITITGVSGPLLVTEEAGNVIVAGGTVSDTTTLSVAAGNITFGDTIAASASVSFQVQAGNVALTLPAATPARLTATTTVGDINLAGWPFTAARRNVTGSYAAGDLNPVPSATITATVATGTITCVAG